MKIALFSLILVALSAASAAAEEQAPTPNSGRASSAASPQVGPAPEISSVYEDADGGIVIVTPKGVRRLVGIDPSDGNDSYDIVLEKDPAPVVTPLAPQPKPANNGGDKKPDATSSLSLADKARVSRLLYEANQHFFKGDVPLAWTLIDEAESINPDDFRVLTMKGSILLKTGAPDLAIAYWQRSLAINPNQSDVKQRLATTPASDRKKS